MTTPEPCNVNRSQIDTVHAGGIAASHSTLNKHSSRETEQGPVDCTQACRLQAPSPPTTLPRDANSAAGERISAKTAMATCWRERTVTIPRDDDGGAGGRAERASTIHMSIQRGGEGARDHPIAREPDRDMRQKAVDTRRVALEAEVVR